MNFEQHLLNEVKSLRERLRSAETLEAFTLEIKAEGRVHDGEVKITFSLDHPYQSRVEARGNSLKAVTDEFIRRNFWNKENAPLMISEVKPTEEISF